MKHRLIAIMMVGVLTASMSVGAFADSKSKGKVYSQPDVRTSATATMVTSGAATTTTSPGGVIVPGDDFSEYKSLQNKLEVLKKQLLDANNRIKKATGKDKKSLENSTAAYNKQIKLIQSKMAELLKEYNEDKDDDKYNDKQEAYIKSIEAILKKNNPTMVMIPADKIITDNPVFKTDLPLAVKDGVVYMAQSTLEKSFGVNLKYEETQKKFISKMEGSLVEIFLLQNYIEIDGVPKKIDAKPITLDGKIYFPLNGIDKLLRVEVKWNNDLKVVIIDDLDIANAPVIPVQ